MQRDVNTYHTESYPGRDGASVGPRMCLCERKRGRKTLNLARSVLELNAATSELPFFWLVDSLIHIPGDQHPQRGSRDTFERRLKAESHLIWPLLKNAPSAWLRGSVGDSFRHRRRCTNWPITFGVNSKRNFYQAIFVSPRWVLMTSIIAWLLLMAWKILALVKCYRDFHMFMLPSGFFFQ